MSVTCNSYKLQILINSTQVFLVHGLLDEILACNLCYFLFVTRATMEWNDEEDLLLMQEMVSCEIFRHQIASREREREREREINSSKSSQISTIIRFFGNTWCFRNVFMTIMMRYSAYARKEYKELVLLVKSQQSTKLSMIIHAHLQSKKSFNNVKKTPKNKIFYPHFFLVKCSVGKYR